jgi:hypothetical protein
MDVVYKNAATERPVTGFAVLVSAVRKQINSPSFDKLDKFFSHLIKEVMVKSYHSFSWVHSAETWFRADCKSMCGILRRQYGSVPRAVSSGLHAPAALATARGTDPVAFPYTQLQSAIVLFACSIKLKCAQNKIAVPLSVDQQRRQEIVLHHPVV